MTLMNTISLGKILSEFNATLRQNLQFIKLINLFKHKIVSANNDDTYIEVEILSDDYLGFTGFFYNFIDVKVLHFIQVISWIRFSMSSKIDFQNILDLLSMIKQKDQWEINDLIEQLNITKKDLYYLLNVLSEIQSDYDLFFDIKVNEDNQLITFEYSSFLEDFQTITDGDLFNLYFLLKIDDLVIEDSYKNNVSIFISVLDEYINLDKLTENNVPISELFTNDNLFIEYLKLGSNTPTSYNIKPLTLKSNDDELY